MRIDFGTPTRKGETVSVLFLPSASLLIAVAGDTVYSLDFDAKLALSLSRVEALVVLDEVEKIRALRDGKEILE